MTGACALLAAAALAAGQPVVAPAPPPGPAASAPPADPRIRVVPYDPDRVTPLDLAFGFQTMLQFGPDERIENVSIGDGAAWQVTPNKSATLLFVKPIDIATRTNMTVVTDRRSYLFELNARPGPDGGGAAGEPPYVVRFSYPPEKVASGPPRLAPPERRNTAYAYTGSRRTLPSDVFDDGKFTYFRWPENVSTPALFVEAPDGSESLVDYSVRDGFQIVEQVAPRFVLRNGKDVTTIINEGWREPQPGPDAPRPADARTARAAARGEGER